MTIGKSLLRLREEKNLSQAQVARKARLAASYISRIENDHIQPTTATLARLATALDVPVSQLFKSSEVADTHTCHECPASFSGACVGTALRSGRGRRPAARGQATYGPDDVRVLRMTDYVILHGSADVRRSLGVLIEALFAHARRQKSSAKAPGQRV